MKLSHSGICTLPRPSGSAALALPLPLPLTLPLTRSLPPGAGSASGPPGFRLTLVLALTVVLELT